MALAAKATQAATTHGVIHLARPPDTDPDSLGILAHELVHAKAATRRTRLLHDPRLDEEERVARAVGAAAAAEARGAGPPAAASPHSAARARDEAELSGEAEAPALEPDAEAAAAATRALDIDDLLVAMEERLLAEFDRRGGRYAGVF